MLLLSRQHPIGDRGTCTPTTRRSSKCLCYSVIIQPRLWWWAVDSEECRVRYCRHPSIGRVDIVEIDGRVVNLCRQYLPQPE